MKSDRKRKGKVLKFPQKNSTVAAVCNAIIWKHPANTIFSPSPDLLQLLRKMPSSGNGVSNVTGTDSPALDHTNTLRRNKDNKENAGREATDQDSPASIGSAAAHATFPSWINIISMVSLIFGGCCANVGNAFKHVRHHVADNLP